MTMGMGLGLLMASGLSATPEALLHGEALYRGRQYSQARTEFQTAMRNGESGCDVWFYLGRLALWFDDDVTGRADLEKAKAMAPNDARIQNALGDAYGLAAQKAGLFAKLGWAKKCRAAYERAVELEPTNPNYRWSLLGYFDLAPRIVGGGSDRALAEAAEIGKLDPMNGRIARATLDLSENRPEAAFHEFEEVLRQDPGDFLALYHLGRCAAISGLHLDQGRAALMQCLSLPVSVREGEPDQANVHYRLGNILEAEGNVNGARAEYAAAYALEPDFRPAKFLLRF
jgi:tetratricopeptide (TPR) repeat protein